jgi:hypothetical protein
MTLMDKTKPVESYLYASDKERIVKLVLNMGHLSSEALKRAMEAFVTADEILARKVETDDDAIDAMEAEGDLECLRSIAMRQPVRDELRFIFAVLKTMTDVAESLPALWRAEKIQKKAARVGFDWPDISGAMDKLREELVELEQAQAEGGGAHIEEELGDLLFAAVNAARFSGVDPEAALHKSCEKFIGRFGYMEAEAAKSGRELSGMSFEEMDGLYNAAKHAK